LKSAELRTGATRRKERKKRKHPKPEKKKLSYKLRMNSEQNGGDPAMTSDKCYARQSVEKFTTIGRKQGWGCER